MRFQTRQIRRRSPLATGFGPGADVRLRNLDGFATRLRYRVDEIVRTVEAGSCSLQEEQVLSRSVDALIGRRDGDREGFAEPSPLGIAPHQQPPRPLERGEVCRPASERGRDARVCPDVPVGHTPDALNGETLRGIQEFHRALPDGSRTGEMRIVRAILEASPIPLSSAENNPAAGQ
jgi:hypothetical protein